MQVFSLIAEQQWNPNKHVEKVLGELGEGEVAEIPTRILRDQLGTRLAKAANVDFDAPLGVHGAAAAPAPRAAGRRWDRRNRPASRGRTRAEPSRRDRFPHRPRRP